MKIRYQAVRICLVSLLLILAIGCFVWFPHAESSIAHASFTLAGDSSQMTTLPTVDEMAGGDGGYSFTDVASNITGFYVWTGGIVDAVQIRTEAGNMPIRGSIGGNKNTVTLDEHEYVTAIVGTAEHYVKSLGFKTNTGRTIGPFGATHGTPFEINAPAGYKVTGLKGRAYAYLDAIGILVGPATQPTLKGILWEDRNGDGIQDPDEPVMPSKEVHLFTSDNVFVATTTSDGLGNYKFLDLPPGDYYVTLTATKRDNQTAPLPIRGATFYDEYNYAGAEWLNPEGVHNYPALLNRSPSMDDRISSIRIDAGYSVRVCEHPNAVGKCETYRSSVPRLETLNDQISYIEVLRDIPPTPTRVPGEGRVFIKNVALGRYIQETNYGNIRTDTVPHEWELIVVGSRNGNEVVYIKNPSTGNNIDYDYSDNIDINANRAPDKQWELVPYRDHIYLLRNIDSGRYMDGDTSNNYNVSGSSRADSDKQWYIISAINSQQPEQSEQSTPSATPVATPEPTPTPPFGDGNVTIQNVAFGRYLQETSSANIRTGTYPYIWELVIVGSHDGNHVVHIRNSSSGRYVDYDPSNVDTSINSESDKKWELVPQGDNVYLIRNMYSRRYLDADTYIDFNVETAYQTGHDRQWRIIIQ